MSHLFSRPVLSTARSRGALRLAITGVSCVLLLSTVAGCGSESGNSDDGADTATDSSQTTPAEETSPSETAPDDSGDQADSPSTDATTATTATLRTGDEVVPGQAVVVSASNVKGETSKLASALVDDASIDAFLGNLDQGYADKVRVAAQATEVPAGSTLFGAIVSVGCEEPTSITWDQTFDGIEVSATVPKSDIQCLVPVTSIALFVIPG